MQCQHTQHARSGSVRAASDQPAAKNGQPGVVGLRCEKRRALAVMCLLNVIVNRQHGHHACISASLDSLVRCSPLARSGGTLLFGRTPATGSLDGFRAASRFARLHHAVATALRRPGLRFAHADRRSDASNDRRHDQQEREDTFDRSIHCHFGPILKTLQSSCPSSHSSSPTLGAF